MCSAIICVCVCVCISNLFYHIRMYIYMAMLKLEIVIICKNKNMKWPITFTGVRFIDNGFGMMRGNKKDVETWINEFNNLRENI